MKNDFCWVTIGKKAFDEKRLETLVRYSPRGIRINMGRSECKWAVDAIETLVNAGFKQENIFLDIGNNKPRVSVSSDMQIYKGQSIAFSICSSQQKNVDGAINNIWFGENVMPDNILELGDGELECKVLERINNTLHLISLSEGTVTNRMSIGIKGKRYSNFCIEQDEIRIVRQLLNRYSLGLMLSFVEKVDNLIECKSLFPTATTIIPKIESLTAYKNADSLMKYSDFAILGRGDMALSVGIEKLGVVQKDLLNKAKQHRCKLIIASGTLESLSNNNSPSRSEVIDISNSYFEGAQGILLTNETAAAAFPFKAIDCLYGIIECLESSTQF